MRLSFLCSSRVGLVAILVSVVAAHHSHAEDEELRSRFLDEAPREWADIRVVVRGLHYTVNEENTFLHQGEHSEIEHIVNAADERLLYRWSDPQSPSSNLIMGINPDYSFKLIHGDDGKSWMVAYLSVSDREVLDDSLLQTVLFSSLKMGMVYVDWLVKEPGFRLDSISKYDEDPELVQVTFRTTAFVRSDYRPQSGTVVLDPRHKWVVNKYDMTVQFPDGPGRIVGTVEYPTDRPHPLPLRHVTDVVDYSSNSNKVLARRAYTFSRPQDGSLQDEECRLSAFGLPEPQLESRPSYWLTAGYVALGVVFILLAIYIRQRRST